MRITLGVFFFLIIYISRVRLQSYPVDGILRFTPLYYISLEIYTQEGNSNTDDYFFPKYSNSISIEYYYVLDLEQNNYKYTFTKEEGEKFQIEILGKVSKEVTQKNYLKLYAKK